MIVGFRDKGQSNSESSQLSLRFPRVLVNIRSETHDGTCLWGIKPNIYAFLWKQVILVEKKDNAQYKWE